MKDIRKKMLMAALAIGFCSLTASAQERAIEMRADRVIIYPQRMELTGEETLMDVLRMYPDLMQSGFESMVSGYNVRLDNSPVNQDSRIFLNQLKAKLISKIQICDNTAVAKGTTGMNRVLDINLLRNDDELHGVAGAQAGTDDLLACNVETRLGSKSTDVYATASYSYQDQDASIGHKQYLFAHMTNWFSPHDRLLTYFTQQYHNVCGYDAGKTRDTNEKYLARARYFHNFNDKGTELLVVGSYQYSNTPRTVYHTDPGVVLERGSHTWMSLVELNTPLVCGLDMMLGWEGDLSRSRYEAPSQSEQKYNQYNNDIYLQLNYKTGIWRFTLGDRVMFYHYGTNGLGYDETRNNVEASVVASVAKHSQIQGAYHRKFSNPSFSVDHEMTEDEWLLRRGSLSAAYIDEFKLAYVYTRPHFSWSTNCYYLDMENGLDTWKFQTAAYCKTGILSLTGGVNLYKVQGTGNDFATFHLDPSISLPCDLALGVQSVFVTDNSTLSRDEDVYMAVQLNKSFGKHWNIGIGGHDLFSKRYSACMGTVQYRF